MNWWIIYYHYYVCKSSESNEWDGAKMMLSLKIKWKEKEANDNSRRQIGEPKSQIQNSSEQVKMWSVFCFVV